MSISSNCNTFTPQSIFASRVYYLGRNPVQLALVSELHVAKQTLSTFDITLRVTAVQCEKLRSLRLSYKYILLKAICDRSSLFLCFSTIKNNHQMLRYAKMGTDLTHRTDFTLYAHIQTYKLNQDNKIERTQPPP